MREGDGILERRGERGTCKIRGGAGARREECGRGRTAHCIMASLKCHSDRASLFCLLI